MMRAALPAAPFSTTTTGDAPFSNRERMQPSSNGPVSWSTTTAPMVPDTRCSVLAGETELHESLERAEPVTPGDLLAFVVLTAGIRNRDLVDAVATAQHLGRDLGLEVEAVGDHRQPLEDLGVEQLVTGLHVRQRRAVQHVGHQ